MFKQVYRCFSSAVKRKDVWTNDKIVLSPFKDVDIPNVCVHEYVFENLSKWASKTAVVCGITNRGYTYEQVYKQSKALAANLRKKFHIRDGDAVAIISPNYPEYATAVYGVLAAGAIVTTLNPVYTSYEVQRLLEMAEASLIIAHPDVISVVKKSLELIKKEINIIAIDVDKELPEKTISFKELVNDKYVDLDILKHVKRNFDDVSFLLFSSGTTGLPKAVELTHYNIIANCQQQNTELRQYSDTTDTQQNIALSILPMFHSYGLGIVMLHKMSVGLKLVTLPRFQPDLFLNTLLTYKINLLYVAPPIVLFLGSYPQVTRKHFVNVECMISGAAPLPAADIKKLLDKAERNIEFYQGYGMTEASPLVTVGLKGEKFYETVGYGLPNIQMRIADKNLNNLRPDEVGELLIRGPNVMRGYKNNPKANSEVFVDGDWFRTGDIGSIDETGLLKITDRLKELIKVKGLQVAPAELENVIKEHPDVFDAAVVGIPDHETGEKPKAFVVLKEGSRTTEDGILEFVKKRVAPFKRLKSVTLLDSIPKNPSGKILRKVLKEEYCK